jgi:hypothetical protein
MLPEFGYAGSGVDTSAFSKVRVVTVFTSVGPRLLAPFVTSCTGVWPVRPDGPSVLRPELSAPPKAALILIKG